jgi:hypothetical protein
VADGINSDAFFRTAALAAVAPPEGTTRTRNFAAARKVLGAYTRQVVESARDSADTPSGTALPEEAACPLRADEPREGLPDGKAFELAPQRGERLIQVPRVLGGGAS